MKEIYTLEILTTLMVHLTNYRSGEAIQIKCIRPLSQNLEVEEAQEHERNNFFVNLETLIVANYFSSNASNNL